MHRHILVSDGCIFFHLLLERVPAPALLSFGQQSLSHLFLGRKCFLHFFWCHEVVKLFASLLRPALGGRAPITLPHFIVFAVEVAGRIPQENHVLDVAVVQLQFSNVNDRIRVNVLKADVPEEALWLVAHPLLLFLQH